MRDFGSTFKLQPIRPLLASRAMGLYHPAAAAMQPLLLSTWGCCGSRRKGEGRRQRGEIKKKPWELVQSFAGIVFWHRFHKAGFGYFSSDITVQQLTRFMGMLEA